MFLLTHCRGLSLTGQIHPHYSKISFMNNLRKDIFMLNKNSIQPLYKQLMDIITQQIKNGTYKPGEKIPPRAGACRSLPCQPDHCPTYRGGALHAGLSYQASGKGTFVKSPMIFRKFESQKI